MPHRFEVSSIILSMVNADRDEFVNDGLGTLDVGRAKGQQRTFRLPFTDQKIGLSISYTDGPNWLEELRRLAVQMEQSNCTRWLVVQMADRSPYEISKIEVISPGRFTNTQLAADRTRHEDKTQQQIARSKHGRNEQCPCGSGKKFKKCHGSYP